MKLIMSMHAYDVLDSVYISVLVREYKDYEDGPSELVFSQVQAVQGEGVTDPRNWLQDVLVAVLETL